MKMRFDSGTLDNWLRSKAAIQVLLALALVAQVPHTATVFHRISEPIPLYMDWAHAVFYALALEFATLIFVVRGQTKLAWGFALVSVAVNLVYYAGNVTFAGWGTDWGAVASATLISFALPCVIAFYAHDMNAAYGAQPKRKPAQAAESATQAQTGAEVPATSDNVAGAQEGGNTGAEERKSTQVRKARKPSADTAGKLTPAQRRAQIAESGLTSAHAVMRLYNVSLRTAQEDLRVLGAQVNGAAV